MMTDEANQLRPSVFNYEGNVTPFDWSRLAQNHGTFVNNIYNGFPVPLGPNQATFPFYSAIANPFNNINPFTCTTNTLNTPMAPSIGGVQSRMTGLNEFRSIATPHTSMRCKRKTDSPPPVATKQHITEEKMALHMSQLHISSESVPSSSKMLPESQENKEKRLYLCEEMRKLQTDSILPKSILDKITRPCTAVVLWQPPQKPFPLPNTEPVDGEENNNNGEEMLNNNNNNLVSANINPQPVDIDIDDDMDLDMR